MSRKGSIALRAVATGVTVLALLFGGYVLFLRSFVAVWHGPFLITHSRQSHGLLSVDTNLAGGQLRVRDRYFERGLATHSESLIRLRLPKGTRQFLGAVAIDDTAGGNGEVVFRVLGGATVLFDSDVVRGSDPPKPFSVSVVDLTELTLVVDAGPSGSSYADHADWLDLRLE